jgi:hypothetical protein
MSVAMAWNIMCLEHKIRKEQKYADEVAEG